MLAPHLGNSGERNNARAGEELSAWRQDSALCLASDGGFSRSSAGYVGYSDGWQDLNQNGRMTWTYAEANVHVGFIYHSDWHACHETRLWIFGHGAAATAGP